MAERRSEAAVPAQHFVFCVTVRDLTCFCVSGKAGAKVHGRDRRGEAALAC